MSNFKKASEFNTVAGKVAGSAEGNDKLIGLQLTIIQEEWDELLSALTVRDTRDSIADLLVTVYGLAHILGIDADNDFEAVHESNMSKFCKTSDEAYDSSEWYRKTMGLVTKVKQVKGLYVILSDIDQVHGGKVFPAGKILKSINYKAPIFQ